MKTLVVLLALSMLAGCAAAPGADPGYEREMERARQLIEEMPQSEREAFQAKMAELYVFVRHLRCQGAMQVPAPDRIKHVIFAGRPLSWAFTVQYPLVIQVQIEPYDAAAAKVQLMARQQAGEAPWEITEVWTEGAGDVRNDLGVPSGEIQQRVNKELPRLLREGEQQTGVCGWPAAPDRG